MLNACWCVAIGVLLPASLRLPLLVCAHLSVSCCSVMALSPNVLSPVCSALMGGRGSFGHAEGLMVCCIGVLSLRLPLLLCAQLCVSCCLCVSTLTNLVICCVQRGYVWPRAFWPWRTSTCSAIGVLLSASIACRSCSHAKTLSVFCV